MELFDFILGLFQSDLNIVAMDGGLLGVLGGPIGIALGIVFEIFKRGEKNKKKRKAKEQEAEDAPHGRDEEGNPLETGGFQKAMEEFMKNLPDVGAGDTEPEPPEQQGPPESSDPEEEDLVPPSIDDLINAGTGTGPDGDLNVPPPPSQPNPTAQTSTTQPKQKGFFDQILDNTNFNIGSSGPSPADERRRMQQFNADQMEQRRLAAILREMQKERMMKFLDEVKKVGGAKQKAPSKTGF